MRVRRSIWKVHVKDMWSIVGHVLYIVEEYPPTLSSCSPSTVAMSTHRTVERIRRERRGKVVMAETVGGSWQLIKPRLTHYWSGGGPRSPWTRSGVGHTVWIKWRRHRPIYENNNNGSETSNKTTKSITLLKKKQQLLNHYGNVNKLMLHFQYFIY